MSVGKKESKDWQDSYYSMEEKYLAVQKKLNQKEEELKMVKVKHLKESMASVPKSTSARNNKRDGESLVDSPRGGLNNSNRSPVLSDRRIPSNDMTSQNAQGNIVSTRSLSREQPSRGGRGTKGRRQFGRGLTNSRRMNGSVTRGFSSVGVFPHKQEQLETHWEGMETAQINAYENCNLSDIGTRPTYDTHYVASAPFPNSNIPRNHPFSAVGGADMSQNLASLDYLYSIDSTREAAYGASGLSGTAVDPLMMLWGHSGATEQANVLMNVNTQLKATIDDIEGSMKTIQRDLANCRETNTVLQKKLDENQAEMHQLVRERDLAAQKLHNSNHTISQQQQSLQVALDDKENIRYGLESQIRELRSRLMSSTDNSEEMASDVRTLLADLRESNGRVAALESKVRLLESNNVTQSNTNQTLVVEAESLSQQLANERRKVLGLMRDLHSASTQMGRIQELEGRVSLLQNEKLSIEKEHIRLLDDMMKVTQTAASTAREEVQAQLVSASEAAYHWERVSKLLYKDVADRTTTHIRCREECEEAKRGRDEAEMILRRVRQDLEMSNAKLAVIWPNHIKDTMHFDTPASIIASFKRIQNARNSSNTYNISKTDQISGSTSTVMRNKDLSFLSDIPLEEQVMELQEANSALVAELEAMNIANELLTEQLRAAQGVNVATVEQATKERDEATDREIKGHQVVMAQNQRIAFLEEQVSLMRGVRLDEGPSLSLDSLGSNETIIEVFIGQLLSYYTSTANPSHQLMPVDDDLPMLFCTIDFLIHETVTSTVVTGFNSFFDLSVGYRIKLDSLFLYYICTRGLVVQLHRVKDNKTQTNYNGNCNDTMTNSTLTYETIGEGIVSLLDLVNSESLLLSPRPQLKGHITLHPPSGAKQLLTSVSGIPAVEFSVTLRTPFPATFVDQCRKQICDINVKQRILQSHKQSLLNHQRQRTQATGPSLELSTLNGPPFDVIPPDLNTTSGRIYNTLDGGIQSTAVAGSSLASLLDNIRSVSLRPVSLQIEHSLTDVPMVSLFYLVPTLGLNECHVPFPYSAPRYDIQYQSVQVKTRGNHFEDIAARLSNDTRKNVDYNKMDNAFTKTLPVPSGHRLAQAIQEPIPIFAFDDSEEVVLNESVVLSSTNHKENSMVSNSSCTKQMKYWGIAVISWMSVFSNLKDKYDENGLSLCERGYPETILTADMLTANGSKVATLKFGVSFDTKPSTTLSVVTNTRNEELNYTVATNCVQTGMSSIIPLHNNNYTNANNSPDNYNRQSSELSVTSNNNNSTDRNFTPQLNREIATQKPNLQPSGSGYESSSNVLSHMTSNTATTLSASPSDTQPQLNPNTVSFGLISNTPILPHPSATLPTQQEPMNMSIYATKPNQALLRQQSDNMSDINRSVECDRRQSAASNIGNNNTGNNNNNTIEQHMSEAPSSVLARLRARRVASHTQQLGSTSSTTTTTSNGSVTMVGTSSGPPSTVHSFLGNDMSLR